MAAHGSMRHRVTHGTQCLGLDAAGCQADLHLLAASRQGSGVSAGASAPGSRTPACASWVEPCVIVRLMFSEAGLRLASGDGTGYSSVHGLLTCDPFTGGIQVELLLVVLGSTHSRCRARRLAALRALQSAARSIAVGKEGRLCPATCAQWRCRRPWWGCSF